jgi:hypothetical protein
MNYFVSTYQDNSISRDDCVAIKRIDKDMLLVIVCDGVTSSQSGRIASHIITKTLIKNAKENIELLRNIPNEFIQLLIKSLNHIFLSLHESIFENNKGKSKEILEFDENNLLIDVADQTTLKADIKRNILFQQFADSADLTLDDFRQIISSPEYQTMKFSSTISFLFFEKVDLNYYKVTIFNLGDGFILKTNLSDEKQNWDFKDLAFSRSSDSATPQYDSRNSIRGEYELSIIYTKANCVFSIGSDGSKLKDLEYLGQRQYQYEYFREFSELLNCNVNDFKNSSEKWYNHVKKTAGIGDDFSLVSIYLK